MSAHLRMTLDESDDSIYPSTDSGNEGSASPIEKLVCILDEVKSETEEGAQRKKSRSSVSILSSPAPSPGTNGSSWKVMPVFRDIISGIQGLPIDRFVKDDKLGCIYWCHPDYDSTRLSRITRMIAFDLDGCLITTKSGKKFPIDYVNDWKPWHSRVASKLKELYESGAYLCIISNQNSIGKGIVQLEQVELKIRKIVEVLGIPMILYVVM